jgi:CRP/FNR family transcriptional regulator, cyclic AMP receptor protein
VLTTQGGRGRQAFVVVDGHARVLVDMEPVAAAGPGDIVGEMAMLDNGPRSATVVADTPMCLLVIGPQTFGVLTQHPAVARAIATQLVERLRRADAEAQPAPTAEPASLLT